MPSLPTINCDNPELPQSLLNVLFPFCFSLTQGLDLSQDDILERSNNESVLSTILEYGNNYLSIESIEELNIEKIENHLESIENEIKDKDFPKTQKSIEDVKESIDIIKMKNDMTNV